MVGETKQSIVEIEELIEKRANEKYLNKKEKDDSNNEIVPVKIITLLDQLMEVKKGIDEEHKKALGYWKEGMNIYYEFMKKHTGSNQLQAPPEKPTLPKEYEIIDGYINMFKCINKTELNLKFSFLKEIFIKASEGWNSAISSTNYYSCYCSGNSMALSNFTLGVDSVTSTYGGK